MRLSKEEFLRLMQRSGKGLNMSDEQRAVVDTALAGKNILVDACVGSGKTHTLRILFASLKPKNVLYLTYNRLLKLEAQDKIESREGSLVTNYHSFVYHQLVQAGLNYTNERGIPSFINACNSGVIEMPSYDILMIDEYQDITDDIADLLKCVKKFNPTIQIIAVGDMGQKIHDYTPIDVEAFIAEFLGEYVELALTQCFRLSSSFAAKLGRCWGKTIVGVNEGCSVEVVSYERAIEIALTHKPEDILCLGSARSPTRAGIQNSIEKLNRKKFNKHTLYSSIQDTGDGESTLRGMGRAAIFTSYDKCKGLERDICFVCDFTEAMWNNRKNKTRYHILRNLYCVAASRGKKQIYMVLPKDESKTKLVSEALLSTPYFTEIDTKATIATMFIHVDTVAVRKCRDLVTVELLEKEDKSIIPSVMNEGYIDLSPCIGIYQSVVYFETYPKDALLARLKKSRVKRNGKIVKDDLKVAVLCEVASQVRQSRYKYNVYKDYFPKSSEALVKSRLAELLPSNAESEVSCSLDLNGHSVAGRCDALHEGIPYELKFTQGLADVHFLQCASYVVAMGAPYGILWNTRDNTCYKVEVPDRDEFKKTVYETVFNRRTNS